MNVGASARRWETCVGALTQTTAARVSYPRASAPPCLFRELLMTVPTSCIPGGLHVAPRRQDAEELPWVRWDGGKFRVTLSTCILCKVGVMYELGTVGGSDRIRRTGLTSGKVHVTVPSTRAVTMARWAALLAGQAI